MLKWEEVGEGKEKLYSQELTLPAYDSPDNVFIVFLEGHKAELVVGGGYPGEPGWMGSVKGGTLGACLRAHDRAHCYKNLPHYDNDEDNFAEWNRIRCRKILAISEETMKKTLKEFPNSWSPEDCFKWQKECTNNDGWNVSDKKMCDINWRSPVFGE